MSWSNRYRLPWDGLDLARIEAAVQHVAAGWSERPFEVQVAGPTRVCVFCPVTPAEERRWDLFGDFAEKARLYDIPDDEIGWVEIEFCHLPADATLGLPAETWLEMASNTSGNGLFTGCAIEIAERFGRYFGVKCEPN